MNAPFLRNYNESFGAASRWRNAIGRGGMVIAILFSGATARATFHLWSVTELYSSADGTVQFVKLSTSSSFQDLMAGHVITCTGPAGTQSFTFPVNLPSSATAGKTFLIGTGNLGSVPGGVTPDYIFTNQTPFLFLNGGGTYSVGIVGSLEAPAVYTNLPSDGVSSLAGSGSSLVVATNAPKNFNGQSNSIVPVKFSSAAAVGTNFVMTFKTATGVNGAAGPSYTVEYKDLLTATSWTPLTSVGGDGTAKSVSNALSSATQRFFRLNVP